MRLDKLGTPRPSTLPTTTAADGAAPAGKAQEAKKEEAVSRPESKAAQPAADQFGSAKPSLLDSPTALPAQYTPPETVLRTPRTDRPALRPFGGGETVQGKEQLLAKLGGEAGDKLVDKAVDLGGLKAKLEGAKDLSAPQQIGAREMMDSIKDKLANAKDLGAGFEVVKGGMQELLAKLGGAPGDTTLQGGVKGEDLSRVKDQLQSAKTLGEGIEVLQGGLKDLLDRLGGSASDRLSQGLRDEWPTGR
jgi:hypothetical protein